MYGFLITCSLNVYIFSLGELYDVGFGRKMFMMCSGKGPPTGKYFATSLSIYCLIEYQSYNYIRLNISAISPLCNVQII